MAAFTGNEQVKIDMRILSLYELFRWEENGILKMDAPELRNLRWAPDGKSRLIEAALRGIPVQAIFLEAAKDGSMEIIDGAQRIKTFVSFFKDGFELVNENPDWNGRCFSDLSPIEQRKIEDFQLVAYVVHNDSEGEFRRQLFESMNLNRRSFSSQEIRNYQYGTMGIPFIRKLAEYNSFRQTISEKEVDFSALQHQELVLRFMSFYYKGFEEYNGNMKIFLDKTLQEYENYRSREAEFEPVFKNVFDAIAGIWGTDAFLAGEKKRRINLALYDVITYSFSGYEKECLLYHGEQIRQRMRQLLTEHAGFRSSVKGGSNTSIAKVRMRFELWLNEMDLILGESNV